MPRIINFFDGQTSATPPTLGSLARLVTGSIASPSVITAGGGITHNSRPSEMIFVSGFTNNLDITINPQILAGVTIGQDLILIGGANTILLEDGNGLKLDGNCDLVADLTITLVWTGAVWKELSRF